MEARRHDGRRPVEARRDQGGRHSQVGYGAAPRHPVRRAAPRSTAVADFAGEDWSVRRKAVEEPSLARVSNDVRGFRPIPAGQMRKDVAVERQIQLAKGLEEPSLDNRPPANGSRARRFGSAPSDV